MALPPVNVFPFMFPVVLKAVKLAVPVNVGDTANTTAPVPVSSVRAAASVAELKLPNDVTTDPVPDAVTTPVRAVIPPPPLPPVVGIGFAEL